MDLNLGLLAYDIADLLSRFEYPLDISQSDIEPNLRDFLDACLATPGGHPQASRRRVLVEVRNSYGRDLVYPADGTARIFAKIAGTRTFSPAGLDLIRQLGYEITMRQDSPRLPDGYGHAEVIDDDPPATQTWTVTFLCGRQADIQAATAGDARAQAQTGPSVHIVSVLPKDAVDYTAAREQLYGILGDDNAAVRALQVAQEDGVYRGIGSRSRGTGTGVTVTLVSSSPAMFSVAR
jgi:hypothetical protein